MEDAHRRVPMMEGTAGRHRVGSFGFPGEKIVGEQGVIAQLGRDSSLNVFFGRGRRVRLADGTEWRIKSVTSGRHIVPIIRSEAGTIATSGPLYAKRSYGINGKDYGLTLIPTGKAGWGRPAHWVLQRHETEIASVTQESITAHEPILVAAAVMAFTLITHGIPGEADLMPKRD
ncbi:MAG: hypothetical protein HKO63_00175 [Acidimicrobiia bacterium]|nr:hypothetical protein [Acidimicrobiia bacterium]